MKFWFAKLLQIICKSVQKVGVGNVNYFAVSCTDISQMTLVWQNFQSAVWLKLKITVFLVMYVQMPENVNQMVMNTEAPRSKFSASKFDYTVLINFENSCCNVF